MLKMELDSLCGPAVTVFIGQDGKAHASGSTIIVDLEKKNIQKAGKILCDIWNNISIDIHNVTCSYRQPTEEQNEKE